VKSGRLEIKDSMMSGN